MKLTTQGRIEVELEQITFAPSYLDMVDLKWEIRPVFGTEGGVCIGWHIRCAFLRPDTNTGGIGTGHGRWWFIEYGSDSSGLVKTCWAALKMIIEHELHEAFLYQGRRVFDPHADVRDLAMIGRPYPEVEPVPDPPKIKRDCDTCSKTMSLPEGSTQTTCSRCGDY